MKKSLIYIILLLSALYFSACQEENSILGPDTERTEVSLSKETNRTSDIQNCTYPTLIKYSKTLTIDGSRGASINFVYTFSDFSNVSATLRIEPGSYYGYKTFTITFEPKYKTVNLDPHGSVFRIPLHLTLKYSNLNKLDPIFSTYYGNPYFYYIPDDGSAPVKIQYDFVQMNRTSGTLYVFNARLPHFSRFGFCR